MIYEQLVECEKMLAEKENLVSQKSNELSTARSTMERVNYCLVHGIVFEDPSPLGVLADWRKYNEHLQQCEAQYNQLVQERDSLKQKHIDLAIQLKPEYEQLKQDLNQLNQERDALVRECQNKDQEMQRLRDQALQTETNIKNDLEEKLKIKEKNIAELEAYLIEVKKERDKLQTELKKAKELIKILNAQLKGKLMPEPDIKHPQAPNTDYDTTPNISLFNACVEGDNQISYAKTAVEQGADVNIVDSDKNCALHKACAVNAIEIVKLLLKSGANSEVENNQHQKPIDLTDNPEIKLLLYAAHQNAMNKSKSPAKDSRYEEDLSNPDFSPEKDHDLILNLPLKGDSKDASHHHNNGTQQGVTLANGRFTDSDEDSFCFGSQKFITGDSANYFPRGDRTISLWFKLVKDEKTNEYKGGTLFSHCGADYSSNFSIVVNHAIGSGLESKKNISVYGFGEDKELRLYVDLNDKQYVNANNDWIHLVVTSGNGSGTTLFLDGTEVAHKPFFYTTNSKISKFGIGTLMYQDKPTDFATDPMFQGNINDVRVYKRALNKDEILKLYEYQKPKVNENEKRTEPKTDTAAEEKKQFYKSKLTMFPDRSSHNIENENYKELQNQESVRVSNGV